jgi:hypothetical protein
MAEPSRPPNFKTYGLEPFCAGCGRKLNAKEPRWFQGLPTPSVRGWCNGGWCK